MALAAGRAGADRAARGARREGDRCSSHVRDRAGARPALSGRRSKSQRRIDAILASIPAAREQLLVAIEDIGAAPADFAAAADAEDPRERNKLAALERVFEELVNWVDELAERGLAEARRRNLAAGAPGEPYAALAAQGAISGALAEQLEQAKALRDIFQHGYPPRDWDGAHAVVTRFPERLDRFVDGFARWQDAIGLR